MTADTEIPALPSKEELIKLPNKEKFDEDIGKIDSLIKDLRKKKEDLHNKRREIIDGGKVSGSSMTYREALSSNINLLKEIN